MSGEPVTVEIKTRTDVEGRTGDINMYSADVSKSQHWQDVMANAQQLAEDSKDEFLFDVQANSVISADRLGRQIERMQEARTWQLAKANTIVPGKKQIGLKISASVSGKVHHWDIALHLAEKAKKEGYASQAVDGAFVYTAIYIDDSTSPQASQIIEQALPSVLDELVHHEVLGKNLDNNLLYMGSLHGHLNNTAPAYVRPILSFPFPSELLIDIWRGRLMFIVQVNLGRVVEALRAAGVEAMIPARQLGIPEQFLLIRHEQPMPDGMVAHVEFHRAKCHVIKFWYEFLSLEAFVSMIKESLQTAVRHYPTLIEQSSSKQDRIV
jgi:hypothetical protein